MPQPLTTLSALFVYSFICFLWTSDALNLFIWDAGKTTWDSVWHLSLGWYSTLGSVFLGIFWAPLLYVSNSKISIKITGRAFAVSTDVSL